jgi:hypothetical protein
MVPQSEEENFQYWLNEFRAVRFVGADDSRKFIRNGKCLSKIPEKLSDVQNEVALKVKADPEA